MSRLIYLDYHATTPCDPVVVETMLPYLGEMFGNPNSLHRAGRLAADAVEQARAQVAGLIGTQPSEIVFTAGATESDNIALLGLARGVPGNRRRIVTTAIEHKAILNPCRELQKQGFDVVILPVKQDGRIDLDIVRDAITENTLLVSVQAANNEIGTIQPLSEITNLAHEKGAFVHSDAAQAVGKIPVDVETWEVDLLSISAHKLYGPKGVGALYVRGGMYSFPLKPLLFGGGQERELRPGTLNVPGIVGFGKACDLCVALLPEESKRVGALRDKFEGLLLNAIHGVRRNGALEDRLPGNSSLTFPKVDAEALIVNTPDLALSTGSACTSGALEPSHVVLAIGLSREEAYCTVRIGLGRFTTEADIYQAATMILEAIDRLASLQD
jgi:cysteine desulfurase